MEKNYGLEITNQDGLISQVVKNNGTILKQYNQTPEATIVEKMDVIIRALSLQTNDSRLTSKLEAKLSDLATQL